MESNPRFSARIRELKVHREAARDALHRNADKQAFQFDKGRRIPHLNVGDEVLINPHSLELVDVKGRSRKLMQRKIGPFEIIDVISSTAYKLRLPDTYPMHNVVNIQHLTKYYRSQDPTRPHLDNPRDAIPSTEEYKVEKIVGEQKRNGRLMYRVDGRATLPKYLAVRTRRKERSAELLKNWRLQL